MFVVVKISNCGAIMQRKIAAQKCGIELWHRNQDSEIRRRKGAAQKCGGTEMRRRISVLNCSAELRYRIVVHNCLVFAVFTLFMLFTESDLCGICGD